MEKVNIEDFVNSELKNYNGYVFRGATTNVGNFKINPKYCFTQKFSYDGYDDAYIEECENYKYEPGNYHNFIGEFTDIDILPLYVSQRIENCFGYDKIEKNKLDSNIVVYIGGSKMFGTTKMGVFVIGIESYIQETFIY